MGIFTIKVTQKDGLIEKRLQRIILDFYLIFHDYSGLVYDYN
jgi:hypothetical protein